MIRATIRGLQEAQRANRKLIAGVKPDGGLGRAVNYLTTQAERYATTLTHVDTGALRASHRITQTGAARYLIALDPTASNPRSGARTSVYGPAEHARGGEHAFYERTWRAGPELAARAAHYLIAELP